MSFNRALLTATTVATILSIVALAKSYNNTSSNNVLTRAEAPAVIKDVLAKNPDLIMQALKQMRAQQGEESKKDVKAAFEKHNAELFADASAPGVGAKDADAKIVEFFDYHCGYCKRMLPVITQLVHEDKKVHVSFREFPILSDDSGTAARAALAFNKLNPDKYFEFHTALMNAHGKFDDKMLGDIAEKFGVSADKLKKEMDSPETTAALENNRKIADDFGIRGTPAILVGEQMIPGAMSYDDLKKLIADTRTGKK